MTSAANRPFPFRGLSAMSRTAKLWLVVGFLGTGAGLAISEHQHWDERLEFDIRSGLSAAAAPGTNISLADYRAYIDAKPVKGIDRNLSSVAYDYDEDRLLAVINGGPTELLALSKSGDVIGRYPLDGFGDVEGVAYMGGGRVVVSDERSQQLAFFQLPATPQSIALDEAQTLSLGINLNGNKGFEGVTYDAEKDRLYVVKEKNPRQLYEISGVGSSLDHRMHIQILDRTDWIGEKVFATDLSDIHFDPKTRHLILLSDESKLLFEMTDDGEIVSTRNLVGWLSELKHSAPQPEGVTLDKDGNLYVVSEPNLFYAFRKN
ncbi:SdiA-regulated domain-containing protein [Pseudomonas sp. LFM046]|uniref:SdiA-regulated domain-containing protein n=1 Tax=Pseudomonas sp. LFM046 TaxID=1608357 RepID=UPI000698D2E6|nr:SdiA-regulated domain-containing protein [Pseudomonas sp. LFM046]